MIEILQFPFMQRALLAGALLAVLLAVLGVFVVLKKMSFLADGIAHASLAGVALGILLGLYPLATALVVAVVFALVIYYLEKKTELSSDSIIGLIFTSGLALGVVLLSLNPSYQPELISFLFGNILSIRSGELWLMFGIGLLLTVFLIFNYRKLALLVINRDSAYSTGIKVDSLQAIFYVLTAITTVLGIKILGVVLVGALLIVPVSIAKLVSGSFKGLLIKSVVFAEVIVLLGILISFWLNLPTGAVIVLTGILIFIITLSLSGLRQRR